MVTRLTPDGEESLEDKVHGDPVEDSTDTEGLDEVERAKNDLNRGYVSYDRRHK